MSGAEAQGIDFGAQETQKVFLRDINVLTQTRRDAITDESVQELAQAIIFPDHNGVARNKLWHPPMVNMLEPSYAKQYVEELNDVQRTSHDIDELHVGAGGLYHVMIGGHRRLAAMHLAVRMQSKSVEHSTVRALPEFNLPYGEALDIQIQENTHQPVAPVDEARSIRGAYLHGLKMGLYKTPADFINRGMYKEGKVRDALHYCQLPQEIQDMVEGYTDTRGERVLPVLSYGSAIALYPLQKALEARHAARPTEMVDRLVRDRLLGEATQAISRGWNTKAINDRVQNTVRQWREISLDALFAIEDDWIQADRLLKRSHAELARTVVPRFDHLLRGVGGGAVLLDSMRTDEMVSMLDKVDVLRSALARQIESRDLGEAPLFEEEPDQELTA